MGRVVLVPEFDDVGVATTHFCAVPCEPTEGKYCVEGSIGAGVLWEYACRARRATRTAKRKLFFMKIYVYTYLIV